MQRQLRQNGFTMVELVVVIILAAIIAGVISQFIARPGSTLPSWIEPTVIAPR